MGFFKNLFFRSKHTQQPDGSDTALPVSAVSAAPSEQAEPQSGEACPLPEELEKEPELKYPFPDRNQISLYPRPGSTCCLAGSGLHRNRICFSRALRQRLCRSPGNESHIPVQDLSRLLSDVHQRLYQPHQDPSLSGIPGRNRYAGGKTSRGAVGFENTKYFFVLFKNIMGTTPRHYRISFRTGMQ